MSLSPQRLLFVDKYFERKFDGAQAAIDAGYSPKTARQQASRLLTNVNIAAEIQRRLDAQVMTRDEALRTMSDMARADIDDFLTLPGTFPYVDLEKARRLGKTHLIKKVKVRGDGGIEIELYDKRAALHDVGLHHGLWKDGVEIKVDINLVVSVIDAIRAANLQPSDVFNGIIAELNSVQSSNGGAGSDPPGTA